MVLEVVGLDLTAQVPERREEEQDVDRGERIVDRCDDEAVAREDGAGQSEGRVPATAR